MRPGLVRMTLVYEPPLDPAFGAEFARVNLDASLKQRQTKWTSLRHVVRQNENPARGRVRAGVSGTLSSFGCCGRRPAAVHQSLPPRALPAVAVPTSAFSEPMGTGLIAPAVSSTGMADGGSGDADTSNTGPTWAASEANLRREAAMAAFAKRWWRE
jgi:hypothetical protein